MDIAPRGHPSDKMTTKISLGIALCRCNPINNRIEVLLVRKRYTYAYMEFISGRGNMKRLVGQRRPGGQAHINGITMDLLNGMTVDEKLDIRSMNFDQMWYRVWLDTPHDSNFYLAKTKFSTMFLLDGGKQLRKLISKSQSVDRIWEMPKGRKKNKYEPDINCAVREFAEETGIPKRMYKLYPDAKRTITFIDAGVKYVNIYYIAFTKHNIDPHIDLGSIDQVNEVNDMRWMDINSVRHEDREGRLEGIVAPVFKYIKRRVKRSI